jgi:hypothetical protein
MNNWYSMAKLSVEHQSALLDEVNRNRLVRSGRKELGAPKAASDRRRSVRTMASALARALRTVASVAKKTGEIT